MEAESEVWLPVQTYELAPYLTMSSITYGISSLEVHAVYSKRMFGPDTSSSLDFDELERLVAFRDIYMSSYGSPSIVDRRTDDSSIKKMRTLFGRSLALKESHSAGYIISREDLCFKKPSTGYKVQDIDMVVGKKLITDYSHFHLLTPSHIDEV